MMKNKTIDNVEYVDFKTMSKAKNAQASDAPALHTNPLLRKFLKFVHADLNKFDPKDLK